MTCLGLVYRQIAIHHDCGRVAEAGQLCKIYVFMLV